MTEALSPENRPAEANPQEPVAAAWDRGSASYDVERSRDAVYETCLATTRDAIESLAPRRLLDVGCGTGLTTMPVCKPGRLVVAADYSFASLQQLRRKPGAPPTIQADICNLPFRSGTFDVVMCANTLQHLKPDVQVLAIEELRRLVEPGGAMVLTVHHYSSTKQRANWIKEGRPGQPGVDYIFRFDTADLERLHAGRRTVAAMGFGEWPWLPVAVQSWLTRSYAGQLLARRRYGHMLISIEQREQ